MFDLKGKVVLVTGGSRGIGESIVRSCGEAGAHVVLHYSYRRDAADAVAARLPADRCLIVQADFEDDAQVVDLWRRAEAWRGRVDVLVNAAGTQVWAGVEDDFETWNAGWRKDLQINLIATAHLCREAIRHYRTKGGGIIIAISSHVAHQGVRAPYTLHYAASKAGEKALMQSIARCFSRENILAYAIAPGLVKTERALKFAERHGMEQVIQGLAMREMVPPEDIGAVCAFLATGASRHATGTTIDITGATYIR